MHETQELHARIRDLTKALGEAQETIAEQNAALAEVTSAMWALRDAAAEKLGEADDGTHVAPRGEAPCSKCRPR
jgi:Tfp pilus assembly protein FimV